MRTIILAVLGSVLAVGAASAKDVVYELKTKRVWAILTLKTDAAGQTTGEYKVLLIQNGGLADTGGIVSTISPTEMLMTDRLGNGPDDTRECRVRLTKVRLTKKGRDLMTREDESSACRSIQGASTSFNFTLYLKK